MKDSENYEYNLKIENSNSAVLFQNNMDELANILF